MIMADLDLDSQNPDTIREFLNKPVATAEDVLKLISSFHRSITCRQFKVMAMKITEAFSTMQLVQSRLCSELKLFGGDARQMQVETSRMQVLEHGYKSYIPAADRTLHIFQTLCKIPAVKADVCWRMKLKDDAELCPEDLYCMLAGDPVTIQYGEEVEHHHGYHLYRFRFEEKGLRSLCEDAGALPPQHFHNSHENLSFKPSSPRFQRKLDGILRVPLWALSQHPDQKGKTYTIL
ncbi:unnamed protein product [Polarella glacialis]|uniref:Uncharacterized protein n=1 Tax=Polarella glacialis TaxID=89957 RepID=A0A813JS56_POLGL|nr:unnamed protein product [Polarella glacialis]